MPTAPKPATAVELKAQLEAERAGVPFLLVRDAEDVQRIVPVAGALTVGRRESADLALSWDPEVSGVHAQLEVIGEDRALVDDGLSRNGSYVNEERVHGRRRLRDGDVLRFGATHVLFRAPSGGASDSTVVAAEVAVEARVTPAQRRVLVALCRPVAAGAAPATNAEIGDELFLSVEAVKTHLRALYGTFGLDDLPQNAKRLGLAQHALRSGVVTPREL